MSLPVRGPEPLWPLLAIYGPLLEGGPRLRRRALLGTWWDPPINLPIGCLIGAPPILDPSLGCLIGQKGVK